MKRMYKPTNNPVWKEELIMCPSQCFCYKELEKKCIKVVTKRFKNIQWMEEKEERK